MSATAIDTRNLGKKYIIAHDQRQFSTAAEALVHRLKNPFERLDREEFWALRDVSFTVEKGEVLGIIGKNGSGKSTLLKILSRITDPTAGEAHMHGRVGSLLEVGTGFHPELTGRENVYLNGSILGMRNSEIQSQFDEIVEFAEVEQFLDTPVKRYSSGMYVRLAFSVAAHLNPEILLVDEVLAVGDAQFQQKCITKMQDVAQREGRTVLFVSHNMMTLRSLCRRVLLLENGNLTFDGDCAEGVDKYLKQLRNGSDYEQSSLLAARTNPYSTDQSFISHVSTLNALGEETDTVSMGEELKIAIDLQGLTGYADVQCAVILRNLKREVLGQNVTEMQSTDVTVGRKPHERLIFHCPRLPLVAGDYLYDIKLWQLHQSHPVKLDRVNNLPLSVQSADVFGTGYRFDLEDGYFIFPGQWNSEPVSPA